MPKVRSQYYVMRAPIVTMCPICHKVHAIGIREAVAYTKYKGEDLQYNEIYSFCDNVPLRFAEFMSQEQHRENQRRLEKAYQIKVKKDREARFHG